MSNKESERVDVPHKHIKLAGPFWKATWRRQNFEFLPEWLQDNDFLRTGHRPPLPSFKTCFNSIFTLHTETGNIWTHLYGFIAFVSAATWFLLQPRSVLSLQEKVVFSFFFAGAIICLGFSFTFHTVQCHSASVAELFSKLDYSGILMLTLGSFIPWIYYGFYCRSRAMTFYILMISIIGLAALILSLWNKFSSPTYRSLRAFVFLSMGLSSIFPAFHLLKTDGFAWMIENVSIYNLLLMGTLYIAGVFIYISRFPERFFPGRCDYFIHSHQLLHIFVILAMFVHFCGILEMAMKRLQGESCTEQLIVKYGNSCYHNSLDQWFQPY